MRAPHPGRGSGPGDEAAGVASEARPARRRAPAEASGAPPRVRARASSPARGSGRGDEAAGAAGAPELGARPQHLYWDVVDGKTALVIDCDEFPECLAESGIEAGQSVRRSFSQNVFKEKVGWLETPVGWYKYYDVLLQDGSTVRAASFGTANKKNRIRALGLALAIAWHAHGGQSNGGECLSTTQFNSSRFAYPHHPIQRRCPGP